MNPFGNAPRRRRSLVAAALAAVMAGPVHAQTQDVLVQNSPPSAANVVTVADSMPFRATQEVAGVPGGWKTRVVDFAGLVPPGFRLVIDNISVLTRIPAGQRVWGFGQVIRPNPDPNALTLDGVVALATAWQATDTEAVNPYEVHAGNMACHIALETGDTYRIRLWATKQAGNQNVIVTLQGHLVGNMSRGE